MTQGHDKVSVHPDAAHRAPHKPQAALLYYLLLFVISSWAEASDSQMGFWWFLSRISLKDYHCCEMSLTWALPQICAPPTLVQSCFIQKKPGQQWAQPRAGCPWAHTGDKLCFETCPQSVCSQLCCTWPSHSRCFSHSVPLPIGHYHRSAILRKPGCGLLSIFMATSAAKPTKTSTREDWQLHAVLYCIS